MKTFAAVMTGKGTGAISTIELYGNRAAEIVEQVFSPGAGEQGFKNRSVRFGKISDRDRSLDKVVIGREGLKSFTINCHGNPIIVSDVMSLLARNGAEPVGAERLLAEKLTSATTGTIEIEAAIAMLGTTTLHGTRIIANQIDKGLAAKAAGWLEKANSLSPEKIRGEALEILDNSRAAGLIIHGCRVLITGPPNSGKSTLLNCLAGRPKAVVSHVAGTTRDWVTARCRAGNLCVEFMDTAGLEESAEGLAHSIAARSQRLALELMAKSDLVLLVIDGSIPTCPIDRGLLDRIDSPKVLAVLNKRDLPIRLDLRRLGLKPAGPVAISAKFETGIDELLTSITQILAAKDFDTSLPVCFTKRQERILQGLAAAKSVESAVALISDLLTGKARV